MVNLALVVSGWNNVAIAAALEDATGISHRNQRKDKLLDKVRKLCEDEQAHARIWNAALGARSTKDVRNMLQGWHGTACSKMNKTQCIDEFVEKSRATAAASSSSTHPSAPSAPAAEVQKDQVALVPYKKISAKRMVRRWVRADLSSKIKRAIAGQRWSGTLIRDIRRIVSEKVGVSLETGRPRQFFERRLQMRLKLMLPKKRRRRPQKPKQAARVLPGTPPHQAQRERAALQYEDYLSRKQ